MARKILVFIMILLLSVSLTNTLWAANPRDKIKYPFKGEGAGYVLLNWLITPMEKNMKPAKTKLSIREMRSKLMKDAISAKVQGKIDAVFFDGFKRLLVVVTLNVLRKQLDYEDAVLEYHLLEELNKFMSRKKAAPAKKAVIEEGISAAFVDEVLRLKKYLDENAKKK